MAYDFIVDGAAVNVATSTTYPRGGSVGGRIQLRRYAGDWISSNPSWRKLSFDTSVLEMVVLL